MHNKFGLEFSFNSALVSNCRITINGSFNSLDDAINALSIPCGIQIIKSNNIYILKNEAKALKLENQNILIGRVVDLATKEALPHTHIKINGTQIVTNLDGVFTYKTRNSFCNIKTHHLGFYEHDTTVKSQGEITIRLNSVFTALNEVVIKPQKDKKAITRQEPFTIKANNQTAILYPGSSDNILFNMLRLQGGVLAAGEQTKDYIVQGSYRGQTQVNFEGITLFGTGTYNEYIGVINPLMIRDIEIKKTGYNAHNGDRMGGLVNITALNGNREKPELNLRVNNQTFSGYANVPLLGNSSIQLASRQTYYHIYNHFDIPFYEDVSNHFFRDYNFKFSTQPKSDLKLDINAISVNDAYTLLFEMKKQGPGEFSANRNLSSQQKGLSTHILKTWKNGGITTYLATFSSFANRDSTQLFIKDKNREDIKNIININSISLITNKLKHSFPTVRRNQLSTSFTHERVQTLDSNRLSNRHYLNRFSWAIANRYSYSERLMLDVSLRTDLLNSNNIFFQPRLKLNYSVGPNANIYTAAGVYRQYYANDAFIDDRKNYLFKWTAYDGNKQLFSQSRQVALGASVQLQNTYLRAETYYKHTSDLNRHVFINERFKHFSGNSQARGIDIGINRKLKKIEYGLNYTLSKTVEQFDYFVSNDYRPAPQDQRHELKTHVVAYLGKFIFSANYVYGSGLYINQRLDRAPYQRLDAAAMYRLKHSRNKWLLETGFSILNVLNTQNLRPNYFISYQEDNFDIPSGVPFTPTLFVNIRI
ncbi:MAG: TonB-dependent receptor [Bacteroidia bacterium]